MSNILFLIIDMQNGFINNFTEHLVEKIHDFQQKKAKFKILKIGIKTIRMKQL